MRTSTLLAAAFAGVLGGAISSYFTTVYAQGSDTGVGSLHSKNFVLLDESGHKRGEWRIDASGLPVLRLFDARGRVIWDTTGTPRTHLTHEP